MNRETRELIRIRQELRRNRRVNRSSKSGNSIITIILWILILSIITSAIICYWLVYC